VISRGWRAVGSQGESRGKATPGIDVAVGSWRMATRSHGGRRLPEWQHSQVY